MSDITEPPEYCPCCGTGLERRDPPTAHYCEACDDYVFYNPVPTPRVAVLDGSAILLVTVDVPDRDV